ncbi:MAG: cofactor-independent phosphoglycerate mutase [Deltaproteobacteria bacterium]|nr:cofactor-independent phosphoglycerate mutase [Deltaproteobacteria bacterium]
MKYVILIGDGMADYPIDELGGRTPLEYAETPNMDRLANEGMLGLFKSVPDGFPPGSDVANLSILGYDPRLYYTGRAPLEAASIGVKLSPDDLAMRCNLVTLSSGRDGLVMDDYSAGHITTDEAKAIVLDLDKGLSKEGMRFYPGKSYRHLMVWEGGPNGLKTTPPHDISDKAIGPHLPSGKGSETLHRLMEMSQGILKNHPVNIKRHSQGKKSADSIWLWGEGRAPSMPTLKERFSLTGAIISAVDLMNGIGIYAGLEVIKVPNITGYIDTDYDAKASYALGALKRHGFVCVHVEAPDEAGHNGILKDKLTAIEDFDKKVVGAVVKGLEALGPYRLLVITDHPTPISLRTHTSDPVPFVLSGDVIKGVGRSFSEGSAKAAGLFIKEPSGLMQRLFGADFSV